MPLDSSTEIEAPADTTAETAEDVNAAGSSTGEATEGDVEKTLVETIDQVLKGEQEESSTSDEDGEEKPPSEQKTSEDDSKEGTKPGEHERYGLSEADYKKGEPWVDEGGKKVYPKNSQGRIRQLVDSNTEAETRHTSEVAEMKPKAEQMDRVTSFMEEHNIQPHEFDNALNITRLINSRDHDAALQAIEPIYQELQRRAGNVLPAKLQEEVRLGYITEDHARELHRSQTEAKSAQERQTEQKAQEQETKAREQWETHCSDMQSHADAWAKTKAASDPDWQLKQGELERELELRLLKGGREAFPKTKEEAIQLAEESLKAVEGRLKRFQPKPQARTMPQGDHASPGNNAKPDTLMGAIDQALYG